MTSKLILLPSFPTHLRTVPSVLVGFWLPVKPNRIASEMVTMCKYVSINSFPFQSQKFCWSLARALIFATCIIQNIEGRAQSLSRRSAVCILRTLEFLMSFCFLTNPHIMGWFYSQKRTSDKQIHHAHNEDRDSYDAQPSWAQKTATNTVGVVVNLGALVHSFLPWESCRP